MNIFIWVKTCSPQPPRSDLFQELFLAEDVVYKVLKTNLFWILLTIILQRRQLPLGCHSLFSIAQTLHRLAVSRIHLAQGATSMIKFSMLKQCHCTFLRNLRICLWNPVLQVEGEEEVQVYSMPTKMLSRCRLLHLLNILHQSFHCCNISIHSQRVNEMAGKMKITLDFELTGEVWIWIEQWTLFPMSKPQLLQSQTQVGPPNDKVFTMSVSVAGLTFSGTVSDCRLVLSLQWSQCA